MTDARSRRPGGGTGFPRRHGASLILLVVVLVVVAFAVVPVALMWARVHPARVALDDDPGRHGLRYEDVAFASPLDGTLLRGWYIHAERPTGRVLVVAPGIDSNRLAGGITLPLAEALVADGLDVLAFDFRGQGESDGDTLSFGAREQDDVLGAVAAARARGASHVAVLGLSMGSAAAMLAAARSTDIEALVLDSAFPNWEETLRRELRSGWHLPEPLVDYAVFLYDRLSGTDAGPSCRPTRSSGWPGGPSCSLPAPTTGPSTRPRARRWQRRPSRRRSTSSFRAPATSAPSPSTRPSTQPASARSSPRRYRDRPACRVLASPPEADDHTDAEEITPMMAIFGAILPRFLLLVGWSNDQAYWGSLLGSPVWLLGGFIFFPWTTLIYGFAQVNGLSLLNIIFLACGFMIDLGTWGVGFFATRRQVSSYRQS